MTENRSGEYSPGSEPRETAMGPGSEPQPVFEGVGSQPGPGELPYGPGSETSYSNFQSEEELDKEIQRCIDMLGMISHSAENSNLDDIKAVNDYLADLRAQKKQFMK